MGLLDMLQNGGDPGSGLLSFLNSLQQGQPPAQMGLPSDQAQYGTPAQAPVFAPQPASVATPQTNPQPSPMDNAQWPMGPVGAPSQAMAQMPQGSPLAAAPQAGPMASGPQNNAPLAAPAMAAPQGPGFFDRLNTGLQSLGHGGSIIGALTGNLTDPTSVAKAQQAQVANVTAKALIGKGVDPQVAIAAVQPGNTEMLKTLVTQNFGPHPAENLGQGYIRDPQTGKVTRAYEPEDKIPAGFAKSDDGKMNFIPGGPADPAYLRLAEAQKKDPKANFVLGRGGEVLKNNPDGSVTVVHRNEAGTDAPMLTDDGIELAANRIINGEKGVTTGFARSKGDMAAIYNRVSELAKARGIDSKEILSNINNEYGAASAARSSGGIISKMETYATQTEKAIDIAEKASADVPRGSYVPVNKVIQAWQTGTSDPKLAALGQSLETLTQEYARAVGGGHGSVSDKMEARDYLSKAQDHQALVARLNVMRNEIQRAREAAPEAAAGTGKLYRNNIITGSPATPSAVLPEPGAESAPKLQPGQSTSIGGISIKRVN